MSSNHWWAMGKWNNTGKTALCRLLGNSCSVWKDWLCRMNKLNFNQGDGYGTLAVGELKIVVENQKIEWAVLSLERPPACRSSHLQHPPINTSLFFSFFFPLRICLLYFVGYCEYAKFTCLLNKIVTGKE